MPSLTERVARAEEQTLKNCVRCNGRGSTDASSAGILTLRKCLACNGTGIVIVTDEMLTAATDAAFKEGE